MDFDQPETLNFADVDTLFLTSAGYAEDDVVIQRHNNVISAAHAQGVKHIIYTSLSNASDHLGFALAHRWTEQKLRESGMAWTILRNGLYAELIGALAAPCEGRITAPFGYAGISAVAREDLADAAVAILRDVTAHVNTCYELSGVKSFSLPDLAQRIGIPYEPTSFTAERTRLDNLQLLPFQPPMLMSIYASAMSGFLETTTSDLMTLVPHPKDALTVACSSAEQGT
ncbi:MAG: NAD(P)H-binding protein [Reinekea sp.]